MAYKKYGAVRIASREVPHFPDALLLKGDVSDSENLVDDENFGFEMGGNRKGKALQVVSALQHRDDAAARGAVYGADILGSCLGALLVSLWALPLYGIPATLLGLTALNLGLAAIARLPGSLHRTAPRHS